MDQARELTPKQCFSLAVFVESVSGQGADEAEILVCGQIPYSFVETWSRDCYFAPTF